MRLEHSFTVPVPVERAWAGLHDVELIAPCMPGAELTSFDGNDFAGTVRVRLGPVNLLFNGRGTITERDPQAHRVVVTATGAESRGGGTASARVAASLHAVDAGQTRVDVATDLDIAGKTAQLGRGLLSDMGGKVLEQFAACLAAKLVNTPESAAVPATATDSVKADTTEAAAVTATPEPAASRVKAANAETPESASVAAVPETAASSSKAANVEVRPGGGAPTALSERSVVVDPDAHGERADLVAFGGVGVLARRAVPYVFTAAAGFAAVFGVIWWIRRR